MKEHTFEAEYKNKALMQVIVKPPPKAWEGVEPEDVIRISLQNKQYLGEKGDVWIMRPDEALTLVTLLSEAVHYYMLNKDE